MFWDSVVLNLLLEQTQFAIHKICDASKITLMNTSASKADMSMANISALSLNLVVLLLLILSTILEGVTYVRHQTITSFPPFFVIDLFP